MISIQQLGAMDLRKEKSPYTQYHKDLKTNTSREDLPSYFHIPYVHNGYREIHKPWSYYVGSVFRANLESLNVWTHVAGFALVLSRLWQTVYERDFADPHLGPLFASFVSFLLMFAASSAAHLFSHKSITTNCVLFMADISTIGLYGFGTILNHYHYSVPLTLQGTILHQYAVPFGVFVSAVVCLSGGAAKVVYSNLQSKIRVVLMAASIGGLYYFSNIPILYRLIYEEWTDVHWYHAKQYFYFHCTAFFFCSRIPERFFPGRFDIIGNSHQLFHVAMVLCTDRHLDGVLADVDNIDQSAHTYPGYEAWAGPLLLLVILIDAVIMFLFYRLHFHYLLPNSDKKKDS
ncbi:hypothetical protein FSP39_020150 [Pinctada imbricata]|uniref:Uncharacterized protein n=1 Tax=Pinctada imbricata TaxID=66713 RepID=A0AA88Y1G2_PINIB|nr:hypothetical protein FSP39_020150 [Pinctada imbricata]